MNAGSNIVNVTSPQDKPEPWHRSKDGILAGVCKGIATRLEVNPWVIRGLWLVSVFFFGMGIALYIILTVGLVREDRVQEAQKKKILGVCLRIAKSAGVDGVDVGVVRVLCLVSAFMSFGIVVLAYVILHFFMPWPDAVSTVGYQGHPIG